jgi:hypothetical protein
MEGLWPMARAHLLDILWEELSMKITMKEKRKFNYVMLTLLVGVVAVVTVTYVT